MRNLVIVLGDQLDGGSVAFDGFDAEQDAILQMEVWEEATYIPQHKLRLAFFFSAMRHFRDEQIGKGRRVIYSLLDDPQNAGSFAGELRRQYAELEPERLIVVEPGDWRVRQNLVASSLPLEIRADRHFLCSPTEFAEFCSDSPRIVLETFYRLMRRRLGVLIDEDGGPRGGAWNFDTANRESFGRHSPPAIPMIKRFPADAVTRDVVTLVQRAFVDAPGRIRKFELPVTREQALAAVDDFTANRLANFGRYQDAMLGGQFLLYHSATSGLLNLHLLRPRELVDAVLDNPCDAGLNSVEGFIRQVIGWREFVRGLYWRLMPGYAEQNALGADLPVPKFFWTGETDLHCLSEAIEHTIEHAYAHHIERLMVLGLFCLLLGVRPYDVHRWHMSMFWDAVDWVSLPNTLGMSQHADGGVIGTKPYAASGAYINRMSDHCQHCRYDPSRALGDGACPFTTLYWDFLARNEPRFRQNPRMRNQYSNLARKDRAELLAIRLRADGLKAKMTAETFL